MVFVDQFRKPLILLTFLDFGLVDRLWFLRVVLWSCGSLVVFGSRVAHCVSETGKAAKSHAHRHWTTFDACHVRVAHCVQDGKSCAHEPTTKPQKAHDVVFAGLVVFAWLVVFDVFVVFCRACGFLGELVDLRSTVVINGKPQRDLTTESSLC